MSQFPFVPVPYEDVEVCERCGLTVCVGPLCATSRAKSTGERVVEIGLVLFGAFVVGKILRIL